MPRNEQFQLLFIPYRNSDEDKATSDEPEVSWQKHASRVYHRKQHLRKALSARQARSKSVTHHRLGISAGRTLVPRQRKEHEICIPLHPDDQQRLALTNVGGGLLDPFGVAVPADKPKYAIEMLDHAISRQWPAFVTDIGTSSVKQFILSCAMLSPASFYAVVFAAASHAAFDYTGMEVPPENKILRLSYKGLAISHLKQEIADLKGPAPEELLLSIITLAAHGHGDLIAPPPDERSKMKGPLALGQYSQFYGEMQWETAHLIALVSLIEARGGLTTLQAPGLAESIKLADNLEAFKNLRPPIFPLLTPTEQVMLQLTERISNPEQCPRYQMTRFLALPQRIQAHPLMASTRQLPSILIGYEDFLKKSSGCPTLAQLLSARNCMVHELLSQDPTLDIAYPENSPCSCYSLVPTCDYRKHIRSKNALSVDECLLLIVIRFAILAFMLLVLFPLPRITGAHAMLSNEIRQALDRCHDRGLCEAHPDLILYVTVMGGALADKASKSYFVERFLALESMFLANQILDNTLARMSEDHLWTLTHDICAAWLWYDGPYSDLQLEMTLFWSGILQQRREAAATLQRWN